MLLGFSLAPMLPMLVNGLKARDALLPGVVDWIAESFADHSGKKAAGRLLDGARHDGYPRQPPLLPVRSAG